MTDELAEFRVLPAAEDDQAWQERADRLSVEALPQIRAAAERWTAATGGLLSAASIAALLKGPGDFKRLGGWADTLGRPAFLLAVLLALLATGCAAWAAQSSSGYLSVVSGPALRQRHEERYDRAASLLGACRLASLLAAVLLAVSAAALWLGPQDDHHGRPTISVRTTSGALFCGELQRGGTDLVISGGSASATVAVDDVQRFRVVTACSKP